MATPIQSLIQSGTKVWLDSVHPEGIQKNRGWGITGATSNPVIVQGLIKTGQFDDFMTELFNQDLTDDEIAWKMTDHLVQEAQDVFLPVWEETKGNDGYVSFELDPLLEDPNKNIPLGERTRQYIELAKKWSKGHKNRMIKIPNTAAGRDALEELAAAGVTINVTLTFTEEQYLAARDAIWRGAQKRSSLDKFKSVYSIFVSRVDVYTHKHVSQLSKEAQGQVGIVNTKRIWKMNQEFWANKNLPLQQEIIFASTGTKLPEDPPWKYVEAFAGSDIETNPPETNEAVQESGRTISRQVDQFPAKSILDEIDNKVDIKAMENTLMEEGIKKFADPQKDLLALIAKKRSALHTAAR